MKILNLEEIEFDDIEVDTEGVVFFRFDKYWITFENVYFDIYNRDWEIDDEYAIIDNIYDKNFNILKQEEFDKAIEILKEEYYAQIV